MLETVRWITAKGKILSSYEEGVQLLPGKLRIIDQTQLPQALVYLELDDVESIYEAILRLSVRGAPAIGCAAALGLAAVAQHLECKTIDTLMAEIKCLMLRLESSRPTAVNLSWALNRCYTRLESSSSNEPQINDLKQLLIQEALTILDEDIQMCRAIGKNALPLIKEGFGVLTHCNAGALATGDYGTALSPLYTAHESGLHFTVYSDETRPLLQGSRLTAWELSRAGIDVVTICDNAAAHVMKEGRVDLIIVGSDRIASNGDVANKIGTYGLALMAQHHGIPFYVAAPSSTIDHSLANGELIPIEQRGSEEIRHFGARMTAPESVKTYNPAFDVTPHELVSAIITEEGIFYPPFAFA